MSRYDAAPMGWANIDLGEGAVPQPVTEWSVARQMSGGGLPGQARGASGTSVGKGSVKVASPEGRSPWTAGPIRPGGRVTVDARADATGARQTVATMVARDVSGTATSQTLTVGIEDDIEVLRRPTTLSSTIALDAAVDAAEIIRRIAVETGLPYTGGLSGVMLNAVILEPGRSRWDILQEIARATLGWVGIDPYGRLVYRDRATLLDGPIVETIIAAEAVEDVPWRISSDDVADRVEVTLAPPTVRRTTSRTLDVWQSDETILLGAGETRVIEADIAGAASQLVGWCPVWWDHYPPEQWSRWNAFLFPDLSGPQPPDDALAVTAVMLTPSRVRVTVTNRYSGPLWITTLILRADVRVTRGETVTIARGAPADQARSTLTYDLGAWVQDEAAARQILDWLAGQTSEPLPTLERVRVVPDPARTLGQIVKIVDPITQLEAKALITGISMAGADGSLTQHLDLTILWVTAGDVARYYRAALGSSATAGQVATAITTQLGPSATAADYAAWIPTGVI